MTELKPYQVTLELFEGPLDLLLFLVKKDDLDIHNIPISHITKEYLAYLDLMKEFNLDVAGEFLVMAANLMALKSRSLLPSEALNEDEGPDPAAELAQKLLEYQKFKAASQFLVNRGAEMEGVFYRGAPHFEESDKSPNVSMFDLMAQLRQILEGAEDDDDPRAVEGEEFPIEEKMEKILFLLQDRPAIKWEELFADERKRRGIIACFLAMLEQTKLQKIFVRQEGNFGKIMIFKKSEEQADQDLLAALESEKQKKAAEDAAAQAAAAAPVSEPGESQLPVEPEPPAAPTDHPNTETSGGTDVEAP